MYNNLFLIFIFIIISCHLDSQVVPPNMIFSEIEEEWRYISKDSNFVKSPVDKWSSPFWAFFSWNILTDEHSVYIQELTSSQSPYGGQEGCLIHKLDNYTGEPIWIYHNNIYSGNDFREMFAPNSMTFTNEGNIQIVGMRDQDTIDKTQPIFNGFLGQPVKKILNIENGNLMEEVNSTDTFETYFTVSPNQSNIIPYGEDKIMNVVRNLFEREGLYNYSFELFNVNDQMQIDTPFIQSFEDSIGMYDNVLSCLHLPQFTKLDRDSLILLFVKTDTLDFALTPTDVILKWINITDIFGSHLIKEMDITEFLYYPQSFWNEQIYLRSKDDHLFVSQLVEENGNSEEMFHWLLWLSKEGEVLGYIPQLNDVNGYHYSEYTVIGIKDGILYLSAFDQHSKDTQGDFINDILKIEPYSNQIIKIGEIKVNNKQDFKWVSIRKAEILNNDNILLNFYNGYLNNEGYNTDFNLYCSFKPEELGLPVNSQNIPADKIKVNLFPNPARTFFNLEFYSPYSGQVVLFDQLGRVCSKYSVSECLQITLDLESNHQGIFIIQGIGEDGNNFSKKLIVIK